MKRFFVVELLLALSLTVGVYGIAIAGTSPVPAPSLPPMKAAPPFDSFIFSMSYQNEYCLFDPSEAECKTPGGDSGFGLHGLWPDRKDDLKDTFQYCGPSEASLGKNWWCKPDLDVKSQMSAAELEALSTVMPGVASCLYNHEWYAHGTCSGLSVAEYFDDALELAVRFNRLKETNAAIVAAAGKTVDRDTLFKAVEKDLGPKAANAVEINCWKSKTNGVFYFSQIDIALDKEKFMKFPAPESLAELKPWQEPDGTLIQDKGSCPEHGIVVVK